MFVWWSKDVKRLPFTYVDAGGRAGVSIRMPCGPGCRFASARRGARAGATKPVRPPGQRFFADQSAAHYAAVQYITAGPEIDAALDLVRRDGRGLRKAANWLGNATTFETYDDVNEEEEALRNILGLAAKALVRWPALQETIPVMIMRLFKITGVVEEAPWPPGVAFPEDMCLFGRVRDTKGSKEEAADIGKAKFFAYVDAARLEGPGGARCLRCPVAAHEMLKAFRSTAGYQPSEYCPPPEYNRGPAGRGSSEGQESRREGDSDEDLREEETQEKDEETCDEDDDGNGAEEDGRGGSEYTADELDFLEMWWRMQAEAAAETMARRPSVGRSVPTEGRSSLSAPGGDEVI